MGWSACSCAGHQVVTHGVQASLLRLQLATLPMAADDDLPLIRLCRCDHVVDPSHVCRCLQGSRW